MQHDLVAQRRAEEVTDQLLLLEHPAVLTLGRHSDPAHVLATDDELAARGIDVIRVDRGILLRPFVRLLEQAMIDTAAGFGVSAARREGHPGVWCEPESTTPRKL